MLDDERNPISAEVRSLKQTLNSIYTKTLCLLVNSTRLLVRKLKLVREKRTKECFPPTRKASPLKPVAPTSVMKTASTLPVSPSSRIPREGIAVAVIQKSDTMKPYPAGKKNPQLRQVKQCEDKLWGGFSRYALAELQTLKRSSSNPAEVAAAARALADWYTAENDFERGQKNASLARSFSNGSEIMEAILVEAHCLTRMDEGTNARQVLAPLLAKYPDNPNLLLAIANTYMTADNEGDSGDMRLSWINRVYRKAELLPLTKFDPAGPLTIGNLNTSEPEPKEHTAKVSIIVPVFNAEQSLALTLRSIQRQSWRNIEVLVVDDCSTDTTLLVAEAFAASDPRFRIVRQEKNRGSYAARNTALQLATGDFITTHDAGDWSHPQKIEIQAKYLLDNDGVVANHTKWARAFDDLFFAGKFRRKDKILDWNPSSVFFRRTLLEQVGGWDGGVRISADAEFVRRIQANGTKDSIVSAFDSAPLAFGVDTPSSLTKASATHGRTIYHGLRREYREASDHWHAQVDSEALRLNVTTRTRPFPVPAAILSEREIPIQCDVVLIEDFNHNDEVRERASDHVKRAEAAGCSIALFHWKRYEADPTKPLNAKIRQLSFEGKVRIIAPGEEVRTRLLLIGSPSVAGHMIDLMPRIDFEKILVFDDEEEIDPKADENLREAFGTRPTRIAAAQIDYNALHAAPLPHLAPIAGTATAKMEQ